MSATLIGFVALVLAIIVLAMIVKSQRTTIKQLRAALEDLKAQLSTARAEIGERKASEQNLKTLLIANQKAYKELQDEKDKLAATPDTDLVNHANTLFGSHAAGGSATE